jgi:hypothetical protein
MIGYPKSYLPTHCIKKLINDIRVFIYSNKKNNRNMNKKRKIENDNKQIKQGQIYVIYNRPTIYKIGITQDNYNKLMSRYRVYYSNPLCMQLDKDVCYYDKAEH